MIRRTEGSNGRGGRVGAVMLGVLAAVLVFGAWACEKGTLGEDERKEMQKVLQTGVDLDSDPFVQAETLRVLELIGQPSLNHFAEELVGGEQPPMVRVAALRVLLATDHDDVRRITLARFNKADAGERIAIVEAVFEYGSAPLRREITTQALRSDDDELRKKAFEFGPLVRLEEAQESNNTRYLEKTLYPEVGRFVDYEDPVVAASALEALVDAGEERRAEPLLKTLRDQNAEPEKRRAAARILSRARLEAAEPHFEEILDAVDISDGGEFRVPERIDEELVRAATLGLIAIGESDYIEQGGVYFNEGDTGDAIEVLEALASNEHEDAAVVLKVAMQDARQSVRYRAIELFAEHPRAEAPAFIRAMREADFETQKRLAQVLVERFPEAWSDYLGRVLDGEKTRLSALRVLRDVVDNDREIVVLKPLEETLSKLAASDDEEVASLAALMLVKVADDPESHRLLEQVDDPQVRYAYLEHLVQNAPGQHVERFREGFRSDLYALRLMGTAGLFLAFGEQERAEDEEERAEDEEA